MFHGRVGRRRLELTQRRARLLSYLSVAQQAVGAHELVGPGSNLFALAALLAGRGARGTAPDARPEPGWMSALDLGP
jgi:hypothetical protein